MCAARLGAALMMPSPKASGEKEEEEEESAGIEGASTAPCFPCREPEPLGLPEA